MIFHFFYIVYIKGLCVMIFHKIKYSIMKTFIHTSMIIYFHWYIYIDVFFLIYFSQYYFVLFNRYRKVNNVACGK